MVTRIGTMLLLTSAVACNTVSDPSESAPPANAVASMAGGSGTVVASVVGSGHIDRSTPDDRAIRNFTISAIGRADGSASGHFSVNVGPGQLKLAGHVTCVTVIGNRAWVGGVVDVNPFSSPVFAAVIEFVDNGTSPADPDNATDGVVSPAGRDQISVVGVFTVPGDQDTEWCAAPVPGPVMDIDMGNITIR